MIILVNGEPKDVPEGWTVAALIRDLGRDSRMVAVEFNRRILATEAYSKTSLRPADQLEIVHFVQGG